jgi:hypothetical protein
MSTATVIEITRRPEPVVHDPFIDDLSPRATLTTKPRQRAMTQPRVGRPARR